MGGQDPVTSRPGRLPLAGGALGCRHARSADPLSRRLSPAVRVRPCPVSTFRAALTATPQALDQTGAPLFCALGHPSRPSIPIPRRRRPERRERGRSSIPRPRKTAREAVAAPEPEAESEALGGDSGHAGLPADPGIWCEDTVGERGRDGTGRIPRGGSVNVELRPSGRRSGGRQPDQPCGDARSSRLR